MQLIRLKAWLANISKKRAVSSVSGTKKFTAAGSVPSNVEELEEPLLSVIESILSPDVQAIVYFNGGYLKESTTYETLSCVELYTGFTRVLFVPYAAHWFVVEYRGWFPNTNLLHWNLSEFTGGLRQTMEEHLNPSLKIARLEKEERHNRKVLSSHSDPSFCPVGHLIACCKHAELADLLGVVERCLIKGYEEENITK